MQVTEQLVDKLANLAQLKFSKNEKKEIQQDLQSMIAFVEKLQELDTSGVKPLQHMGNNTNVLREDILKGTITREAALQNAPVKNEQFFKVPKMIKK